MLSRGAKLLQLAISNGLEEKNCTQVQNNLSDSDDGEELISNNDFHEITSSTITSNPGFIEISPSKLKVNAVQPPNLSESSSPCSSKHSEHSSMHSSSSLSSSSSDNESCSSSEDCDDLINDRLYEPDEVESSHDEQDFGKPKFNSTEIQTASSADSCHKSQSSESVLDIPSDTVNTITPESSTSRSLFVTPPKKNRKRLRNEDSWRRNIVKKARNLGKEYEMNSKDKKMRSARSMRPPCTERCRLKCGSKFTEKDRLKIFSDYWQLGDLNLQRQFIQKCMTEVTPTYQYVRVGGNRPPRRKNNVFFLPHREKKIRVCKVFFENTLDISSRIIRTVVAKTDKVAQVLLEPDKRGRHNKHPTVDPEIREGIKKFIQNIPRIESHYIRAWSSREYIDGSKSISDLHEDYVAACKEKNEKYGNYVMFYRIFTENFNISRFQPKKDQCDLCISYKNGNADEKQNLEDNYKNHLEEKVLSRQEKESDKNNAINDSSTTVAVYDLQAVIQLPKGGNASQFYYKSKLNVFNFTIHELPSGDCSCFIWDESNGLRGVNELGSCVFYYIQGKCRIGIENFIFFSDNCTGQQKNKFMLSLYFYASRLFNCNITHKFLIKGHTQNEGDSDHSVIERKVNSILRSGPIYTPEMFIGAVKAARKKNPFAITEMTYTDFYDLKKLASEIGPINLGKVKITDTKIWKIRCSDPLKFFYKLSYNEEEFKEVAVFKTKKKTPCLSPAFSGKLRISENKKEDLKELCDKNLIPKFYHTFYNSLF